MHQPVNPTNALSQIVHAVIIQCVYSKVFIYFVCLLCGIGPISYSTYITLVVRLDGVHGVLIQVYSEQKRPVSGAGLTLCTSPLPLYVHYGAVLYNTSNLISPYRLTFHNLAVALQNVIRQNHPAGTPLESLLTPTLRFQSR